MVQSSWASIFLEWKWLWTVHVVGPKSFRPDIQKPRQMENAVRDIYRAIYGEVNVSVEKCVEIKGDYVEK